MSLISTKKIILDFYNKNIVTVNAKQNDTSSRFINIACTDNSKKVFLDGKKATAFIRYTKNDGNIIFNKADILDDGTILVELTQQMLAIVGRQEIEIVLVSLAEMTSEELNDIYAIYENGCTVISTMTFYLNVMPMMADVSVIASTEEYTSLSNALTSLTYLSQLTETMEATEAAIDTAYAVADNVDQLKRDTNAAADLAKRSANDADTAAKNAKEATDECNRILNIGVVYSNEKGANFGVAELNSVGKISAGQIDSNSLNDVIANRLDIQSTGAYVLDAYQGYLLKQMIDNLSTTKIHYNDVVDNSIGNNGDVLLVPVSS